MADYHLQSGPRAESPAPHVHIFDEQGRLLRSAPVSPVGLSVGRLSASDLVLNDLAVSRKHLRIHWDGARVQVSDLGSKGGTLLGELLLAAHAGVSWDGAQPLYVGPYRIELTATSAPPVDVPALALAGAPALAAAVASPPVAPPAAAALESLAHEQPAPTAEAPAPVTPPLLALAPGQETFDVFPGQLAVVSLSLTNQSDQDESFVVLVDGFPASWMSVPAQSIPLAAGAQALIPLRINVPALPESLAGEYPINIRARSLRNPAAVGMAQARWMVQLFGESTLELTPTRVEARERASYLLHLANQGNAPSGYLLSGADEDGALDVLFSEPELTLDPGEALDVPFTVVGPRRLIGRAQRYSFQITAATPDEAPLTATAQYVSLARVPLWVAPLLALGLLLALLGGFALANADQEGQAIAAARRTAGVLSERATAERAQSDTNGTAAAQLTASSIAVAPPLIQTAFAQGEIVRLALAAQAETAQASSFAATLAALLPPGASPEIVAGVPGDGSEPPPPGSTDAIILESAGPGAPAAGGSTAIAGAGAGATQVLVNGTPVQTATPDGNGGQIRVDSVTTTFSINDQIITLGAQVSAGVPIDGGSVVFSVAIGQSNVSSAPAEVDSDRRAESKVIIPGGTVPTNYTITALFRRGQNTSVLRSTGVLTVLEPGAPTPSQTRTAGTQTRTATPSQTNTANPGQTSVAATGTATRTATQTATSTPTNTPSTAPTTQTSGVGTSTAIVGQTSIAGTSTAAVGQTRVAGTSTAAVGQTRVAGTSTAAIGQTRVAGTATAVAGQTSAAATAATIATATAAAGQTRVAGTSTAAAQTNVAGTATAGASQTSAAETVVAQTNVAGTATAGASQTSAAETAVAQTNVAGTTTATAAVGQTSVAATSTASTLTIENTPDVTFTVPGNDITEEVNIPTIFIATENITIIGGPGSYAGFELVAEILPSTELNGEVITERRQGDVLLLDGNTVGTGANFVNSTNNYRNTIQLNGSREDIVTTLRRIRFANKITCQYTGIHDRPLQPRVIDITIQKPGDASFTPATARITVKFVLPVYTPTCRTQKNP